MSWCVAVTNACVTTPVLRSRVAVYVWQQPEMAYCDQDDHVSTCTAAQSGSGSVYSSLANGKMTALLHVSLVLLRAP